MTYTFYKMTMFKRKLSLKARLVRWLLKGVELDEIKIGKSSITLSDNIDLGGGEIKNGTIEMPKFRKYIPSGTTVTIPSGYHHQVIIRDDEYIYGDGEINGDGSLIFIGL
ncbi:MAG: hypothetical protein ACXQTS_01880 [Candidatus Methanospirareceae archaeon]